MIKNLTEKVKYIGVDDTELKLFENQYILPEGMAYNSYLILDEKVAILDTVDRRKAEEWKEQLNVALEGRSPDYLIVHHLEPDHSSLVAWAVKEYPELKVVASAKALSMLELFFEDLQLEDARKLAIKEGDTLCLGEHELKFYAAPMVHWPEVMISFDLSDGTLYSADAFGKFGALSKCGFTGSEDDDWACEARRYYFNIVGKYGVQVQNVLSKLSALDIKRICALHGPVLEEELAYYIGLYKTWSAYEPETEGVFIAYASIHGCGTKQAALELEAQLKAKGVKISISNLCGSDIAENVEDAFKYSRMILCASSYDGGLFSPMYDFIHRLQIKGYSNRKVALVENGSWAPCAARVMKEMLGGLKNVELVEKVVTIRSTVKKSDLPTLKELAETMSI